jgi:hypothetical protein
MVRGRSQAEVEAEEVALSSRFRKVSRFFTSLSTGVCLESLSFNSG